MAMTLGQALRRFDTDPDTARRLVDEAHAESKSAMSELRNVVRGLHPAILTERGLDAAVSSLAARCPVPVTVDVHLRPGARLPVSIETVAYYVAAEGLTNVARHSAASHAALTVHDDGEELTVSVSDDGTGGASASPGSGLAGLNDRVIAVGGTLDVESGSSGTTLTARLPCAS
jgi:signal transduction histidine kinase